MLTISDKTTEGALTVLLTDHDRPRPGGTFVVKVRGGRIVEVSELVNRLGQAHLEDLEPDPHALLSRMPPPA